jgi:transcription termination factor Rho
MPVLDRSALEASPLADLHAVASELSIDGYRRLRRAELITAILAKQGGADATADATAEATDDAEEPKPRRSRSRRSAKANDESPTDSEASAPAEDKSPDDATVPTKADDTEEDDSARSRRGRRGGRGRSASRTEEGSRAGNGAGTREDAAEEPVAEGVVELLSGGSGFVRVSPPEPSDDDVYISAAQVKRCELVSGDRVSGPKRAPRRSERFASMIRIEIINDRPATELADSVRFEDLPVAFPSEPLKLGSDDPTLKVIEGVTPFGKGSRVSIVGAARSGKTETLKRLATTLAEQDGLSVQVVLAGARPEEIAEWSQDAEAPTAPAATTSLTASEEVVNASIEAVIDQARRLAARGTDAVVLIDSLDGANRSVARRVLGAARNIVDAGSLTVIATGSAPVGGETTVIALDVTRAAAGKFPALDVLASGVLRPELLVGERGAKAIARAHTDAAKPDKK